MTRATRWSGGSSGATTPSRYGAKLTVREGQAAVFVHEGSARRCVRPRSLQLETNNMPILTTLQHWDHGFHSPVQVRNLFRQHHPLHRPEMGHQEPDHRRDPEFGPTRCAPSAPMSMRVSDPGKFMTEIVGTDGEFTADEISFQIRNIIVQEARRCWQIGHSGAGHGRKPPIWARSS
jgi:membrane protease subunit (stomatin/prohibitin family)